MTLETDNLTHISKEELAALPAEKFPGRIVLAQTPAAARKAVRFLADQKLVGFDTETRPAFRKGQNHKVALLQLSTSEVCFLIRLNRVGLFPELKAFLESPDVTKIGLSTSDDFHGLRKLGELEPQGFVELQSLVRRHGIGDAGLSKIYAQCFGKRISKSQQLSNWEAVELTAPQQHYAALDAWACLKIYQKFNS